MIRRITLWLLVLGILLSSQAQADDHATLKQDIILASGLAGLGLQARQLTQQALADTQAPLAKQYEVVGKITDDWAAAPLQHSLMLSLTSYDGQHLRQIEQLLFLPILKSAQAKEQQAIAEQKSAQYQQYQQRLKALPPSAERQRRIQALNQAMHFSALLERTRAAVYSELSASLPSWQPPPRWAEQLRQQTLGFLFYAHRHTSNIELEQLLHIYQHKQLQHWLNAVEQTLPAPKHSLAVAE